MLHETHILAVSERKWTCLSLCYLSVSGSCVFVLRFWRRSLPSAPCDLGFGLFASWIGTLIRLIWSSYVVNKGMTLIWRDVTVVHLCEDGAASEHWGTVAAFEWEKHYVPGIAERRTSSTLHWKWREKLIWKHGEQRGKRFSFGQMKHALLLWFFDNNERFWSGSEVFFIIPLMVSVSLRFIWALLSLPASLLKRQICISNHFSRRLSAVDR